MKNKTANEYVIIFRDKNKNELTRKTVWCYSIIDARRHGKNELATTMINDCVSVIAKRVNNECN